MWAGCAGGVRSLRTCGIHQAMELDLVCSGGLHFAVHYFLHFSHFLLVSSHVTTTGKGAFEDERPTQLVAMAVTRTLNRRQKLGQQLHLDEIVHRHLLEHVQECISTLRS